MVCPGICQVKSLEHLTWAVVQVILCGWQVWSNWAGNQTADGISVVHPRGTDEIIRAVLGQHDGRRLRPIGAGHSFTAIGQPADVQLQLDRHTDLVHFDDFFR